MNNEKVKVLFVCLGNICRSPLAEGIFRHQVEAAGLRERFLIDSAGTSSYHAGDPPDARTIAVARARGIELTGASRQILRNDLQSFDYIIVMDRQNLENVRALAKGGDTYSEVRLLREFDARADGDLDVPDPYYGGTRGFENVHEMVERACAALLDHIRHERAL